VSIPAPAFSNPAIKEFMSILIIFVLENQDSDLFQAQAIGQCLIGEHA